MEQITVAMMKYCLTVLMLFSVPALALDVRALKDKPAAVVEELPVSVPSAPKQPEKKSLVEHLQQTSQTPQSIPSGPPTSLPPSGNLPPLPPSMTAPKGKWSELPPLPDGTQLSAPPPRAPSHRSSSGASKSSRPPKTTPTPTVNSKEKFAQCVSEVQQQSQGKPTKLLRNDNQVYSVVLVENNQRKIITCYANKEKTIE